MPPVNTLDACNPDLNATVSASAGSGKTWLLITRIVRLLLDGAEPGNIIALTFTRKAAGEMQIRLSQRLYEMATVSESELDKLLLMIGSATDTKTRTRAAGLYEKIIHSLYPVRIQTFHSFCQDILSRFPLEADIPPGFELLEDTSLLQRQAWQMLFDEASPVSSSSINRNDENSAHKSAVKNNQRLNEELDSIMRFCNGPDNTFTAINSFLSHRSDWWAFTSSSASSDSSADNGAVDFACRSLSKQFDIDEHSDPLAGFFTARINEKLFMFSGLLREINLKTSNKHADIIDRVLSLTADDNDNNRNKDTFKLLQSAFIKKDGEILVQGRQYNNTLEKKLGSDNAEKFIELHLYIAEKILQINEQLLRILNLQINKAWYYTGNRYTEIFQQLKKEMRLLDFTDLEWKCYLLLQFADNAHWIQYKIDQRIDHILVDEFQDTNPTQWHLLSPILDEIAANPAQRPRSVFLVGDEKQSIYSFRRANPALQLQASQWLAENLAAKATPLDFSRRSSAAIINSVNEIFMQDEISSVMKGFTRHDTYLDTLPGKVVLCDLFHDDDSENDDADETAAFRNPLQQPLKVSIKSLRHKEADYIARQILQLVDSDEYITDGDKIRHVDYGDIMILMRNRTHLEIYENSLKRFNIPFIGSKKGGLLDNLEIQDLSCLLNTLITPYDNLTLAQVLKSPVFSASDDDLVVLASQSGHKHWYERLLHLASNSSAANSPASNDPDSDNYGRLSRPLQRAAHLLPRWQQLAEQLPVHDCLDKIFSEGNIINRYIAANRTENKQKVAANCQRFLELSLDTDSGRYPSITRFLQKLSHLKNYSQSPPEEPLSQSSESRVRLMTIHGSKGLESPVIFLADCNNTASNKNAYSSLVRWPASKNRPVNFQLQLSKENTDKLTQKLQLEKLKEQDREELNLLYVALTRAREQLYISGIKSSRSKDNSWYQIINNGLQSITESETTIDELSCRVYRHLAYERPEPQQEEIVQGDSIMLADNEITIDQRLSKPFEQLPAAGRIIAPSLQSDDYRHRWLNDTNPASTNHGTAKLEADDAGSRFARWRGTIIHKALEAFCNAQQYSESRQILIRLTQQLAAQTMKQEPAYITYLDECIQEADATFNHPDLKEVFFPPENACCYNEMPLMYSQGQSGEEKNVVYGIIDRVIKTDSSVTIIDYKSHLLNKNENTRDITLQFSKQLEYYRSGINKLWPQHTVKTGILFTRYNEMIWLEKKEDS